MSNPVALVIEDDRDLATLFAIALRMTGVETEIVHAGDTALARLAVLVPDLVVLDLHIPRTAGIDILRQIRADARLSGTHVVVVTGGTLTLWHAIRGNVGDLITLAALVQWALYSILARRAMRQRSALSAAAFSAFLGLPLLLAAAAWELHTLPVDLAPQLILALVYLGVAPGLIGLLAWNAGVRRLGPSGAMVFYNTLPLYGALLGYLFLHEPIGPSHLIGGALIVSGGLWAARER